MTYIRATGLAALFLILFATSAAHAEKNDNAAFKFEATFPCQSAMSSRAGQTGTGDVVTNMYACSLGNHSFAIIVTDYPAGTVTDKNRDTKYAGSLTSAANNVQGRIRSNFIYKSGNLVGRDAIVDNPGDNETIRTRLIFSKDRLYQVIASVETGKEDGIDVWDFFNSFRIEP